MANIIEIEDYEAPELDVYARLTEAQLLNRDEPFKAMFIADSPYVIMRALDAGCVPASILAERHRTKGGAAEAIARCGDVPVYVASMEVLTQLTGFRLCRGVLCAMRRPAPRTPAEVLRGARRVVVLDRVQNHTDVGAVFRSAAALGMDAVLLTPGCGDPLYPRSARVSMGAVFQLPWAWAGDRWLEELRAPPGFATAALALRDDARPVDDPELRTAERLAVVLGSEGDGLDAETVAACDYAVKIPMRHGADSLNVAAACAVAFWELRARD